MIAFIFLGMESDFGFHWLMLLSLVPLIGRWVWDRYEIVVQQQEPDHLTHTIVTGIVMLFLSFFEWMFGPARFYIQPVVLSFCLFAALFSYGLSVLRGLSWWYIDEGLDGKQSWTDSIYVKLGVWKVLLLNLWFLLLGFSVYFYISWVV